MPVSNIPLVGVGQVNQEVHEVHFGERMYNRDLPDPLRIRGKEQGFKLGFKFTDVLTALTFALKNKDKQREYPLAILFYDTSGQLCSLYLDGGSYGRDLSVDEDYPGSLWDENVRFLVVAETLAV